MVAGYAIGGGHVLHVVCDLTIAADNARFGQTGPKVGSFDGGFGAGLLAEPGRAEEGQGDLVPVPPVRRGGGARDGPGEHRGAARGARGGDGGAGAARCSTSPPSRCACSRRASTPPRTATPASSSSRTTPTSSSTPATRRTRAARRTRRSARPTSAKFPEAAVSRPPLARLVALVLAARPRTLPAAVAPVLVGTALAGSEDEFRAAAVRGRAGRQRLHPDRDEPLERLLGRPPRRRHRGPARARCA